MCRSITIAAERHPPLCDRSQRVDVLRHRPWRRGQRQSVLTRRDRKSQQHRTARVSLAPVRAAAPCQHRRGLRSAAAVEREGGAAHLTPARSRAT
jgi:hypothetical protein